MLGLKNVSVVALTAILLGAQPLSAQLLVDFNSTSQDGGPHNEAGFQPYDAGHEEAADFVTKDYTATTLAGDVVISVTPAWTSTADNRVQQMIDRGAGNDVNWVGNNIDLLTDWIGSDSRTASGGNGDWDRTGGTTPTYMNLTLSGLPIGQYEWVSYHHDTEKMWADFQVEISTDGGNSFDAPIDMRMTSSTAGSNPPEPETFLGDVDPDPKSLPSTFTTVFFTPGDADVVLRFAPFANGVDPVGVHKSFFGMNGFELTHTLMPDPVEVPTLSAWGLGAFALAILGAGTFLLRRRRRVFA